jgi:lambda repressor-like predicted transcriptional regulator
MTENSSKPKKIHHGEWLKSMIEISGKPLIEITKESGVSRSTIWRMFSIPTIKYASLVKVCHVIGIRVSEHLPEFLEFDNMELGENEIYQKRYYNLLTQYRQLITEFEEYRESFAGRERDENAKKSPKNEN